MVEKLVKKLGVGIVLVSLSVASVGISGCEEVYFPAGKYENLGSVIKENDRIGKIITPDNDTYSGAVAIVIGTK